MKVYARFKNNIWAADLAEMGLLFSFNCGIKCLLRVIDVFTKYTWVKHLAYEIPKTVLHGFIEIVNESKCKPIKLCVDKGRQFYNKLMQKLLDSNGISMN